MNIESQPNIIFIVLDTCRADIFYQLLDEGKLPGIQQIAADATKYRNATSVAPWTVPSHGSMFSGLYPAGHGTSADDPYFDPPTTPLAELLRLEGYETVGLSANPWITPNFDFTAGFERFKTENELFWGGSDLSGIGGLDSPREQLIELLNRMSLTNIPKTVTNAIYAKVFAHRTDDGASRLTSDAIKWFTGRSSDNPFFLFCNYTEPHLEYDPPAPFLREELPETIDTKTARSVNQDQWAYITGNVEMAKRDFEILRSLYRAEIRYLDSKLARLFKKFTKQNPLNNTAFILTSDHGENIGEHDLMDHQYCLYETLLHVPLLIRYPPLFKEQKTNSLVETHRLYETITDIAGIEETAQRTAPSLVDSSAETEYTIAEYTAPQPSVETLDEEYGPFSDDIWRYDRALRSIRNERWKFIERSDRTADLYDLHTDPDELTPIENSDLQTTLQDVLETRRGALTGPSSKYADIDTGIKQQLRDLGYL